ncbi:MAG: vWA domain-containing protein [Verrucomicrobiaceae bacterium]
MSNLSIPSTPEARRILAQQQRVATISSFIIALLVMGLIALILAIIMMVTEPKDIPTIVTYSAASEEQTDVDRPVVRNQVAKKPASPSSSMSRVIASTTASPTAVPVPIFETTAPADFGDADGFGDGFADGDFGAGGGSTTFFGQTVTAERIAYVIDFSGSMRAGSREKLMRAELHESLEKMYPGTKLGMVFFSGPAWVAGGKVSKKDNIATVKSQDGNTYKWKNTGSHNAWEHEGKKEPVPWFEITDAEVLRLQKIVKTTPLSGGTVWNHPLNMVLDMDPAPQMVYFMTDGAANGSDKWAKEIAARARKMGVTINCVAMMVPKAIDDLDDLSRKTGGKLTIVHEDGTREIAN